MLIAVIFSLPDNIFAQELGGNTDKTIYLQPGYIFSHPRYVKSGEIHSVGRAYSALVPIMIDYPEAHAEILEGVEHLRKSDKASNRIVYLWLTLTTGLELLQENNMKSLVLPVGLAAHGVFWTSLYSSMKEAKIGINKVQKAVWIYNRAVLAEASSD